MLTIRPSDVMGFFPDHSLARIYKLFAGAPTVGAEQVALWGIPRSERVMVLVMLIKDNSDLQAFTRGCLARGRERAHEEARMLWSARAAGEDVSKIVFRVVGRAQRMSDAEACGYIVEHHANANNEAVRVAELAAEDNDGELNRQLNRLVTIHTTPDV